MIVDGRAIAEDLYAELAPKFDGLGMTVKLGIIVVGENPVIESFVGMKMKAAARLGVAMVRVSLPETAATDDVAEAARKLVHETDAVIIQLPLPEQVDTDAVLAAVSNEKDVDALNPTIPEEKRFVHAPVALAAVEILKRSDVSIRGARTVVVGAGRLVGTPTAWLLTSLGADVSMFTLDEGSIEDLKDADIIVLGAGNPGFIQPDHIKEGVALIDAGTSELKKKIIGDADPACALKAAVFTPVPGGVGPIAIAEIFMNLFTLKEMQKKV